jgi:hypothetical protein
MNPIITSSIKVSLPIGKKRNINLTSTNLLIPTNDLELPTIIAEGHIVPKQINLRNDGNKILNRDLTLSLYLDGDLFLLLEDFVRKRNVLGRLVVDVPAEGELLVEPGHCLVLQFDG